MKKILTVVFCLFVVMAYQTQAETVNWIVTADKTSVTNNNADGINFQITLLDANGSVDTTESTSNIYYRVYAYSPQAYVYGSAGNDGLKSDYLPPVSGDFKDNLPSMDYGTYWVSGQTAAAEGHSAFIRAKNGLAGFNMWFKDFTGTAYFTLKLEKITAPNSAGGVDIVTMFTKDFSATVTAGSSDVTKLRIEQFNKSAQDTLADSVSDTALPIADGKCQLGKISGSTVKIKLYKDTNYLIYSEPSSFTGTVYLTLTGFNPNNPTMASGTITLSGNVADSDQVTINGIAFEFDNNSSVVETSSLRKVDISGGTDKINAGNKLAQAVNNCSLTSGNYRAGDIYNEYIRAVSDNNGNVTIYSEGQSASAILLFKAESGAVISLPNNLSGGTASRVDAAYNNATGNTFTFSGTITNASEGAIITLGDMDKDGKAFNKAGWYWMRAYVTVGSTNIYSEAGLDRLLVLPPDVTSGVKLSMALDKNYVHKDTDQLDPLTEISSINTGWAYIDDTNGNHCRFNTENTGNVPASITVLNTVTGLNTVSITIDKRAPRKSINIPSSQANISITTGSVTLTISDSTPTNALTPGSATMTVVDTGISARFLSGLKSSSTLNKNVLISNAIEIFKDDGDGLPGQSDATLTLSSSAPMTVDKTVTIAGLNFTAKAVENTAAGQFNQSVDASAQAASLTRCINDYGRDPIQAKYLYATVSGTTVTVYYGGTASGVTATCNEANKWTFGTGADLITTAGFTAGAADSALDSSSAMTLTMEWFQNYNSEGSLTATVPANQTSLDLIFSKAFYPNGISVKGGGRIWGNFVKFKVSTSSTTYGETIVPIYDASLATLSAVYTRSKANSAARTNNVNDNDTGVNAGSSGSGPGKGPGNSSGLTYWGSSTATGGWGVVSRVSRGAATTVKYVNGLGEQVSMPAFNTVAENGNSVFYLINGADNLKNTSSGDRLWTNWNGYNSGNTNYSGWGIMTGYFAQFDINSEELYASDSENSQDKITVASSRGATIGYYTDAANSNDSSPVAAGSNYFFVGKKNLGYYTKFTYASTDNGTQDTITLTSSAPGSTPLELRINVAQTRTLTSINATAARSSILPYDENVIRVEALDQYGKQIEPSGANAIYMTYDTSKGTFYNYARNTTAPGAGGGVLQYTNGTFTQLQAYGTTPKPLMYFSFQQIGAEGMAQITFEDAAKTITKKKVVSFNIGGGDPFELLPVKYLPYLLVDNNWDSYIAIQNYGTAEARNDSSTPKTLQLTAYDKTGAQIGTAYKSVVLAANGMTILDARTVFGATPVDGTMMIRVIYNPSYSLKVMGIMTNKNVAEKNNFMLEDAVSASGQTLVVPEIIDATNYKTTLVVCNAGSISETVSVVAKDSTGASYTKSETIPGYGFKAQDITSWFSSPSFAGKEGWVKATATNNALVGAVIYTNATGARNTKGVISLSTVSRTGSLSAYVPMAVYSSNFVTPQIYFANNSGSAVDVTVKAVKQDGTDFGTAKTTNIAANGWSSTPIDKSYFSSTSDMPTYFTLKITSASTEIYPLVAYVFSTGYSKSSGDFVLATPLESSSTSALNIPFYLTISPYSNYLFIQNTGTASNAVTITAYKPDGTSAGSTVKYIGANAMEFFVNDLAPNGYGAIKISGGAGILCTSVTAYGDGTKEIWGGFSVGN